MLWGEVNLEAVFTGVSGARHKALDAVHGASSKVIILDGIERHFRKALQNSQRLRALNGKLRKAFTGIFDLRACAIVRSDVLEILILITCIHAKEIARAG